MANDDYDNSKTDREIRDRLVMCQDCVGKWYPGDGVNGLHIHTCVTEKCECRGQHVTVIPRDPKRSLRQDQDQLAGFQRMEDSNIFLNRDGDSTLELVDREDFNGYPVVTVIFDGFPVLVIQSVGYTHSMMHYLEPADHQVVVAFLEAIGHYGEEAPVRFLEGEDLDEAEDTDDGHAICIFVGEVAHRMAAAHPDLPPPQGF